MGDPYKGKLRGHAMRYGAHGVWKQYPDSTICQCGARSPLLRLRKERIEWHRQHKADVLDSWVANGVDDFGKEVHL